jgi:hypothetical protein
MQLWAQRLQATLRKVLMGRPLSRATMQTMSEIVADVRQKALADHVDFPVMACLMVPRTGQMFLLRADLEGDPLRVRLLEFIRRNASADVSEIALAIAAAFPQYSDPRFMDLARKAVGMVPEDLEDARRTLQ